MQETMVIALAFVVIAVVVRGRREEKWIATGIVEAGAVIEGSVAAALAATAAASLATVAHIATAAGHRVVIAFVQPNRPNRQVKSAFKVSLFLGLPKKRMVSWSLPRPTQQPWIKSRFFLRVSSSTKLVRRNSGLG